MKYLVLTLRTPNFQIEVLEAHCAFLEEIRLQGKLEMFGPFTDKSGGAYIIKANNLEEALRIAHQDPVFITKSSTVKVYEWNVR